MGIFANLLSVLSISAGSANTSGTILVWFDEPECPKDLL
jgi:cyclic lactone autoinducer peptide